ncbi:MAG TPA: 16S rRNA (guanine(527)-N(7))-methyltransferase RsmG [Alphaproteobacteria bacterium]|nr:16S rRNA (guanine(527)-N(7))-methyltransferase RsmG [Alphaproteobacteria bacterium]
MVEPLTPAQFAAAANVSRETQRRLEAYAELLLRWQRAVNLVANSTIPDLWRRHMLDSAQLVFYLPTTPCRLADLGSGAGFPGLVLAILGVGEVHLVESDGRKCAFLREALRVTGTAAFVHEERIESVRLTGCDVVTARGLASLEVLVGYARPFLKSSGIGLFLKGRRLEEELTPNLKGGNMRLERFPSVTEPGGWVVRLGDIAHV